MFKGRCRFGSYIVFWEMRSFRSEVLYLSQTVVVVNKFNSVAGRVRGTQCRLCYCNSGEVVFFWFSFFFSFLMEFTYFWPFLIYGEFLDFIVCYWDKIVFIIWWSTCISCCCCLIWYSQLNWLVEVLGQIMLTIQRYCFR